LFEGRLRPLQTIHCGRHFTNMFMRCYPEKNTTKKILEEGRMGVLDIIGARRICNIAP
jgi:hypothetical protein